MRRPRRSLTLVTGPAYEPITASEAMAWARVDDSTDQVLFSQLIAAARMAAEEYLRRALMHTSFKLTLDLACSDLHDLPEGKYDLPITVLYGGLPSIIELPKGPVSSITSIVTYGLDNTSSTFAAASYYLATDRVVLNSGYTWPTMRPVNACEITYVAGYGANASAVPQPIKTGMMIHVASLYEQRGQCEDAMDLPAGTKQLYNQYRIMGNRLG